jgi:hypothetical protein
MAAPMRRGRGRLLGREVVVGALTVAGYDPVDVHEPGHPVRDAVGRAGHHQTAVAEADQDRTRQVLVD